MFYIPEIEPCHDDARVKSKMAVQWLNEGMIVQLSFEPRSTSLNVDATIDMNGYRNKEG